MLALRILCNVIIEYLEKCKHHKYTEHINETRKETAKEGDKKKNLEQKVNIPQKVQYQSVHLIRNSNGWKVKRL